MAKNREDNITEEQKLQESIDYEFLFYSLVTGTDKFEVIPLPDASGETLTQKELRYIENECLNQGIKLVYRISHGTNVATIFNKDTKITGIVPESNSDGFFC